MIAAAPLEVCVPRLALQIQKRQCMIYAHGDDQLWMVAAASLLSGDECEIWTRTSKW
jgi:hypothetical protein